MEFFESSDSLMKELSRSTLAMIQNGNLVADGDNFLIQSRTLQDAGVCASERFSNQTIAANCSGFLISPDTIVTAGHCVNSLNDCQYYSWVFDYANYYEENPKISVTKDKIYKCVKVLAREKDAMTMNDFAVLKLDRAVRDRQPLKVRTKGKLSDDAVLTVIGHPMGLPLKISTGADLRLNDNPIFFKTNSDTYGGNSGSAVIDTRTGIVEGILVRGDTDFTQSPTEPCKISVRRDEKLGLGEDATRITNIFSALKKH